MKPLEALRALGTGGEAPAEAKQRVYGSLLAAIEGAAAAAAVAGGPKAAPPPSAAAALVSIPSSKALLIAGGIWLIGGATGAALYGAFQREQVRVVYVDRPVLPLPPRVPISAEPPLTAAPSVAASSIATRQPVAAQRASVSIRSDTSELGRERALLDRARADAAHGEPARVLEQVEAHRQQFPHGRLVEERDALGIRALLALGRSDEARARADMFRASYPNSFLMPVIDSALSTP